MGATWRFALLLCMVLMVSRSLANEDTEHATGSDAGTTSSPGHQTDSGHGTGEEDSSHGESGHGGEPITTLPIVSWKWHHVSTPYIVVLWILVSWLCKIGQS
ncbi:hypothetical protein NQZ68_033508 [Dissostichus eleginoides]|nr:hypothetical protein NQZ68_033508 [Dissostichus eleginoides]